MKRVAVVCAIVALTAVGSACDEGLSSIAGPTPTLTPTLAGIQEAIFSKQDSAGRLACVQCHTDVGRTAAGPGLVLLDGRAYQSLVGVASRGKPGAVLVIPGDPDNSYLVQKLEGTAGIAGQRMPRGTGPFLTEGQMLILRRWIQLGAQNNQ